MELYFYLCQNLSDHCRKVSIVLHVLNRQNELRRLTAWATNKQLAKPLYVYQNRLDDEEKRLFHHAVQSPQSFTIAQILFRLNELISPTPRYLPKGSAQGYSYRSLTYPSKSHSMRV